MAYLPFQNFHQENLTPAENHFKFNFFFPFVSYTVDFWRAEGQRLQNLMVHFRKRLTPEVLGKINEMILNTVQKQPLHDYDDNLFNDGGSNSGTMIVDITCTPSNIRYPQDASLLMRPGRTPESCWMSCMTRMVEGLAPTALRRSRITCSSAVGKKTVKKIRKAVGRQLLHLA